MSDLPQLSRRSFLMLPALVPFVRAGRVWGAETPDLHRFTFDHVVGTSLDLDIWSESPVVAEHAAAAVLDEVDRLTRVLSTRDPESEISRLSADGETQPSPDLAAVFAAYDRWSQRTGGVVSITPRGPGTPLNVDALGKAFILDRAAAVAAAVPGIDSVLLNIGGDIVVRGRGRDIAIADPAAWQDNASPLTWVHLQNQAVATSGSYARGAHLIDARIGQAVSLAAGASVIAANAVDANALATALCVTSEGEGMPVVERTHGAEAIRIDREGRVCRSSGFSGFERAGLVRVQAAGNWPAGFEVNLSVTLTAGAAGGGMGGGGFGGGGFGRRGGGGGRRGARRPYLAAWIEDPSGRLVRVLAFWADNPRYYNELSAFYTIVGRDQQRLSTLARATRAAGSYDLVWDGKDEKQAPVARGTYRVVVETNQEHGSYGKQAGAIACLDKPAQVVLPATANFEAITIDFGPRPSRA